MPDTTLELARRCPRCDEAGEQTGRKNAPRGSGVMPGTQLLVMTCRNSRCRWFNTEWLVQVNPDGTIPPPQTEHRDKAYPMLPVVRDAQRLVDAVAQEYDESRKPGKEVRGY